MSDRIVANGDTYGMPSRMPRRPASGPIDPGLRPLRHRLREAIEAIDRGRQGSQRDTARELVVVIDGGNLPTQPDRVVWTNPVAVDCADEEGAVPTFTADTSQTIPVVFVGAAPSVGDYAVANAIAGRWVAEKGGGKSHVCVVACGFKPVFGARIDVLDGTGATIASCTTGVTGCCDVAASGSHRVRVTVNGLVAFDGTRTVSSALLIVLSDDAVVCCGDFVIPKVLTLTDGEGSIPFVYNPNQFFPTWFGGRQVQRTGCTVTTPNNVCVVAPPAEGLVRVCYAMTCFAGQGGEGPPFSVQRSWSYVFAPGTGAPTWYQDGFPGTTPGLPCATAPPGSCGSPLTDGAGANASPSATAPFTLSCNLPPDALNATDDPIGGGVVISG